MINVTVTTDFLVDVAELVKMTERLIDILSGQPGISHDNSTLYCARIDVRDVQKHLGPFLRLSSMMNEETK